MEEIRLQKFLAENGIASRRKCEEFILSGRVKVNNEIVTMLGTKINPEKDRVKFDDKPVGKDGKKEPVQYIKAVLGGVKKPGEEPVSFYRIKDGVDIRDILD